MMPLHRWHGLSTVQLYNGCQVLQTYNSWPPHLHHFCFQTSCNFHNALTTRLLAHELGWACSNLLQWPQHPHPPPRTLPPRPPSTPNCSCPPPVILLARKIRPSSSYGLYVTASAPPLFPCRLRSACVRLATGANAQGMIRSSAPQATSAAPLSKLLSPTMTS